VVSGFDLEVVENCALLGYYAASRGNFLPTFRVNLRWDPIGCPEMSVRNYPYELRNNPEENGSRTNRVQL